MKVHSYPLPYQPSGRLSKDFWQPGGWLSKATNGLSGGRYEARDKDGTTIFLSQAFLIAPDLSVSAATNSFYKTYTLDLERQPFPKAL